MQRFRILGLAFLALLVLGSIVSATAASAATLEMLPEASEANPIKFDKVKSGAGALQIKGKAEIIKCASDTGTAEATSKRLGTFDILFEKCLVSTGFGLFLCTGLEDKENSSSILVKGTFHLRRLTKDLKHILVSFLPKEVHFTCVGIISILFRVRGCVLGLITPVGKKTKTYTITLAQKEGVNEFTEVLNDAETATEKCILEASENTGAFTQAGEETTEEVSQALQGGKEIETEIMI
jgi:hypothetical protein